MHANQLTVSLETVRATARVKTGLPNIPRDGVSIAMHASKQVRGGLPVRSCQYGGVLQLLELISQADGRLYEA